MVTGMLLKDRGNSCSVYEGEEEGFQRGKKSCGNMMGGG